MKIRNGKYVLNTDTAIEFDCGSTGRLGHYSTQGDRVGYVCKHKDGAISVAEVGSGYYPSPSGSGYDWERNGKTICTYNLPNSDFDANDNYVGFDEIPKAAIIALCDAGILESIE